jgi:hypothetical protein
MQATCNRLRMTVDSAVANADQRGRRRFVMDGLSGTFYIDWLIAADAWYDRMEIVCRIYESERVHEQLNSNQGGNVCRFAGTARTFVAGDF